MTIGKFNFAPRTQTLYPDAGIQKKMRLTQESEIVTTGCHGRQKIATRAGLVVTKEVLPGAKERGEGSLAAATLLVPCRCCHNNEQAACHIDPHYPN